MTLPPWREEPIGKQHDREGFDCGEPALNDFLRYHARKSHERGEAKTFLAVADTDGKSLQPEPRRRGHRPARAGVAAPFDRVRGGHHFVVEPSRMELTS